MIKLTHSRLFVLKLPVIKRQVSHILPYMLLELILTFFLKLACSWDLTHLHAIMNIFDGTANWKIGGNGLELRNDRPHFESMRASACVWKGKWYYETLLLTSGIMQLGWATIRCRFTPEEGYGVGDDRASHQ